MQRERVSLIQVGGASTLLNVVPARIVHVVRATTRWPSWLRPNAGRADVPAPYLEIGRSLCPTLPRDAAESADPAPGRRRGRKDLSGASGTCDGEGGERMPRHPLARTENHNPRRQAHGPVRRGRPIGDRDRGGAQIGRAIALLLAANGASVLVNDMNGDHADAVVDEIRKAGGDAEASVGDVTRPELDRGVHPAANALAPLRIAVNNAGIGGAAVPLGEYPVDSWDRVIAVSLSSIFLGMRAQLPAIVENGGGAIVNIASILGSVAFANSAAYVSASTGSWA